ncbi:DUF6427 family protein [Paenimyroides viscosum]|jgi:hypothetical protein|uniref:Beta-carotene 15,15'-monooxygenase n=1 Tax=Paenimyroides viscosum TaxID=2488729 RepID=A0A3P1B218_9FLAO|nr:DUF6427 family protein [Paenimyroides viscosum]RRA95217.1 hypothetical protein EG242_06250 [Paenimyroides viscosum]
MLTNLFSKSRPIGYVAIGLLLLLTYFIHLISDLKWLQSPAVIIEKSFLFVVVAFSVLLIQFITVKNYLAVNNLYSLFLYACFLILFPTFYDDSQLILANLLVLLALRRIISLQTLNEPKIKIFDASLWIFVATLFESWTILYFLMIYLAVIWYVNQDYRNWIIPFIALLTVTILFYTYSLFYNIDLVEFWTDKYDVGFNFSYFENIYQNLALSFFASIAVLFTVYQLTNLKSIATNQVTLYKNIVLCFLIGVVIYVISPEKSNGLLVFTFFPLSIIGGNFIAQTPNKWVKEAILATILGVSLLLFLLKL